MYSSYLLHRNKLWLNSTVCRLTCVYTKVCTIILLTYSLNLYYSPLGEISFPCCSCSYFWNDQKFWMSHCILSFTCADSSSAFFLNMADRCDSICYCYQVNNYIHHAHQRWITQWCVFTGIRWYRHLVSLVVVSSSSRDLVYRLWNRHEDNVHFS